MNYTILNEEIVADPLVRGYDAMNDVEVATSLNVVDRTRDRAIMTASEVLNAVDAAEFNTLSDTDKRAVWDVLHIGDINPFGVEATLFVQVFGAGSATILELASIRVEGISRGAEIGVGTVRESDVFKARAI